MAVYSSRLIARGRDLTLAVPWYALDACVGQLRTATPHLGVREIQIVLGGKRGGGNDVGTFFRPQLMPRHAPVVW
ncbi:hypothetical protein BgiBS90_021708 [Biomphalaria glabrata]|nr:hypothetical protein BgiBS90_021708 [Biomphalaria glabrata]